MLPNITQGLILGHIPWNDLQNVIHQVLNKDYAPCELDDVHLVGLALNIKAVVCSCFRCPVWVSRINVTVVRHLEAPTCAAARTLW